MNKHTKIIYTSIAMLFFAACGKKVETPQESNVVSEIKLTPEQKQNAGITFGDLVEREMSEEVKCTGLVDVPPISQASVSLPIAGYVKTTFELLPGKQVTKGQVLATITSLEFIQMQQEYLQAMSSLGLSDIEKSRQQLLNAEEVGSKKKLQQAEADQLNLQAQVKGLGLKLEILGCDLKSLSKGNISSVLNLKSPIDGFIDDQTLAIGKYITPTDVIVKIVGMAHKHVELKVFERDLIKLKLGQNINIDVDGVRAIGKVFLIGKLVDLSARTTSVHGHFSFDSDEAKFTVGQFVSARILVGSQKTPSLPEAGLARVGKGGFIYIENSAGVMSQIPVEILSANPEFVGIRPLKPVPAGKLVISGASALEAIFAKD